MTPVYSVCITAMEGECEPRVLASLGVATGNTSATMTLEWQLEPMKAPAGDVGVWLYHMLERLVTSFDEHVITDVRYASAPVEEEDARD